MKMTTQKEINLLQNLYANKAFVDVIDACTKNAKKIDMKKDTFGIWRYREFNSWGNLILGKQSTSLSMLQQRLAQIYLTKAKASFYSKVTIKVTDKGHKYFGETLEYECVNIKGFVMFNHKGNNHYIGFSQVDFYFQ